jgi:hypothetical protein
VKTVDEEAVDAIITKLDERYPRHTNGGEGWSFYRSAISGWVFETHTNDGEPVLLKDESLESLLRRAISLPPPLPTYPRRPPYLPSTNPKKAGSTWFVPEWGIHNFKTKKEALSTIERLRAMRAQDQDSWDRDIAPLVYGKVEGIDFVWKD